MSEPAAPPEKLKSLGGKAARNERRKAASATLNALSVASIVAALVQPATTGHAPHLTLSLTAIVVFVAMQSAAHYILHRIED